MLLDPTNPLQSITDQSGVKIGYDVVKKAIGILRHHGMGYEYNFYPVKHRLLTQSDREAVRNLLTEANSINGGDE